MGIVVLLESESIVNSLDFESTSSFDSTSSIKILSCEFNHTSGFECSDAFNGIVVNFYAHKEFISYNQFHNHYSFPYPSIQIQVDSIFEHVSSLECSHVHRALLVPAPDFENISSFEASTNYIIGPSIFENVSAYKGSIAFVYFPPDFELISEFETSSIYFGYLIQKEFDTENYFQDVVLGLPKPVFILPAENFEHSSSFECSKVNVAKLIDCPNFNSVSNLGAPTYKVSIYSLEDLDCTSSFTSGLSRVIPSNFDFTSSFECNDVFLGQFISATNFELTSEFLGGFPYEIVVEDFNSTFSFESKFCQPIISSGFYHTSSFHCSGTYDDNYFICQVFSSVNDIEVDTYFQWTPPNFNSSNSFEVTLFSGDFVNIPVFNLNSSFEIDVVFKPAIVELITTNNIEVDVYFQNIIPSFDNISTLECSEVFIGLPIVADNFELNSDYEIAIFYSPIMPDFENSSSFESSGIYFGDLIEAQPFNTSSSFECYDLYDGDYFDCPTFNNVNILEIYTKHIFYKPFDSISNFDCSEAFVGIPVPVDNFELISEFESPNIAFCLNTLDFELISESFSAVEGTDWKMCFIFPTVFVSNNIFECYDAYYGIPILTDNFELVSELVSTTFFSINVIDFDENLTFDCYDVIYGYLFPVVDFELISEYICDDVKKIWRLFAHTSGGQLAQGTHQINLTPLVLYEYSNYFVNELSTEIVFFNSFHNSLRDSDLTFNQYSFNSIGLNKDQYISNSVLDSIIKEQYISVPLANDSFISEHYVWGNLSGYNFTAAQFINLDIEYFGQAGSNGLASLWYDPPPGPQPGSIPVITYIYFDIFIDGISIKERIKDINLTQRESDVISHIEIEFKDTLSFNMCDVNQGTGIGTERIELRIGGDLSDPNKYTTYKFLLEERSANESNHSFTVWGRQITALLAEPFSEPITQTFENRTSSSIAQELAGSISVNWTAYDNLNLEYNLDGTPLAGIQRLAEVVNAIVRTDPDGSIVVRPRFPVRPMDLIDGNCTINITLDRYLNIVSADYSEEQSQYNTVEVQGGSNNDDTNISIVSYKEYNYNIPQEVVDAESKSDFQLDDIAYLRVYHNNSIIYDPTNQFDDSSALIGYSLCTTFNSTNMIQLDNDELIEDEVVDIINGTGNLSKNPFTVNSWHWEGIPKFGDCQENTVIVSFDEGNITVKDPNDNNVLIGKMKVTYTTRYDLFEITCDEEKEIIIAALTSEHLGVYLKITMDSVSDPSEEKPAPKIDDDLITNETTALMRGQSILDDTYYKKLKHTIQIPFYLDIGLFDGNVVRMEDDFWNIIGNAIIRSADISISVEDSGVIKIWQNIELHQYARP